MPEIISYWYFDGDIYTVELGSDFYNKNRNYFIVKRRDGKEITENELKENDFDNVIITETCIQNKMVTNRKITEFYSMAKCIYLIITDQC